MTGSSWSDSSSRTRSSPRRSPSASPASARPWSSAPSGSACWPSRTRRRRSTSTSSGASSRSSSPRRRPSTSRPRGPSRTCCAANFADGDGRLPRTLEKFLGDRGELQQFVNELFDETRRDSAIGRIGGLLGQYFDGDRSKVAQLLDPTRLGSPLHQFRQEIAEGFKGVHERLTSLEAASRARADERSRSAAKGGDFEDLFEDLLGTFARGAGDLVDRTANETGSRIGSKKGDFVLTIDPRLARGTDLRVVIEAKDRAMSQRAMREELREARENRDASVSVAVWTPAHAPTGIAPFAMVGDDVHVVVDPEAPDAAYLEAAMRLARLLALASLQEREVDVDAAAIGRALTGVREQLDAIRALKTQLTSVSNATKAVSDGPRHAADRHPGARRRGRGGAPNRRDGARRLSAATGPRGHARA